MITVQKYIKDNLSSGVPTTEITAAISSLGIEESTGLNESLQERFDAIWSEFNLSEEFDIKNVFTTLKEFNLNLKTSTDEEFIDKIEVIKKTTGYLGYERLEEVTKEELEKIKELVEGLKGKLSNITESDAAKVKKIASAGGLSELRELNTKEIKELIKFSEVLGISLNKSKQELDSTKYVVDFIESQGIRGKELLEEGNVKKLITLFKAFKINNISQWKASTSENLEDILNSFGLEIKSTSSLKLSTKLKKLEGLGLENNLEKASTKISVMKEHVEDLSELSKEEIKGLIDKKDVIDLGLKEELKEIVGSFGIEAGSEQSKYKKLQEFLLSFNVKVEELSQNDAEEVSEVLKSIGLINKGELAAGSKELLAQIIEAFNYGNLINLKLEEIEKLKVMGKKLELDESKIFNKEGIGRIKLITNNLGLDVKELGERELENAVGTLVRYGINEAEKSQGYVSWMVSGVEKAIIDKTKEYAAKVELLGYEITEFDDDEYSKIEDAVNEFSSFTEISKDGLKSIKEKYQKLGIELAGSRAGIIMEFKESVNMLNLSIKQDTAISNLEAITRAFDVEIKDLEDGSKKLFDEYGINLNGNSGSQINELAVITGDLGYKLDRIQEDDINCIEKIAELKSEGEPLAKLKYISGYVAKITNNYSDLREEECGNLAEYVKLLSLEKGGEDYKISLYKKVEEKCQIDYREEQKKEAADAIIKAVQGYAKHEECRGSESDECKALISKGLDSEEEITSSICNEIKEDL
jgi:hypothetical protein